MPANNQVGDAAEGYPLKGMNGSHTSIGGDCPRHEMSSGTNTPGGSPKRSKLKDEEDAEDENVKDLLVYYAKNSTMHGIPTIVGSELYRGRHIFWIIVVCMMAMFLGTVIYWQMSDYYSYPTVTSVDISYVGEDDFPAITVCDPNYLNAALVNLISDKNIQFHLTKLTEIPGFYHRFLSAWKDKLTEPAPTNDSYTDMISDLNEKVLQILNHPRGNPLYCSWGEFHFKEHCPGAVARITEMGPCVTIDTRKIVKKVVEDNGGGLPAISNAMRGLTVYFDSMATEIPYRIFQSHGFKIVLHEPDVEPLPLSSGFLVPGNTTVEVDIAKSVKEGLPPPYEAFGSGSCVDTNDASFENPLRRFPVYSKEVCEAECFIDFVVKECGGCKHIFHPGNESNCGVQHLGDCFRSAEAKYYGGESNVTRCECLMPCRQVSFSAGVSTAPFTATDYFRELLKDVNKERAAKGQSEIKVENSVSYVHFYYSDPVVTTMQQVAIYSTQGLLGNIGGQIGLFMGFSLVTVAEMLELIFLLVTRGRSLDDRVKRHKEAEAAAHAALQA